MILYHQNADGEPAEVGRTVADAKTGQWEITTQFLANRVHDLYVKAQDAAANISASSNQMAINVEGPTEKPSEVRTTYTWS